MEASYWQREAGWSDRWHRAGIPARADFAVIGGGVSGLATAIRLRERHPGAEVVLLEAERVGYGASGRNAGFLSPLAAPVWLLGAATSGDQAWAVGHINERMHDVARWIAACVPDAELRDASLSLEATGRLTASGLGAIARVLEGVGLDHRLAESQVRRGRLSLSMRAYTVHPYRLVRGLAEHAARAGVRIVERARVGAVESPGAAGGRSGARLRLDGGAALAAHKVVVCTNGYTSTLALGERVRALAVRSFMVASAPLAPSLVDALDRDGDFAVELNRAEAYHRLHAGRILYGGMDKMRAPAGGDFAVPPEVQRHLVAHMRRSFPRVGAVGVDHAWGGRFHATTTGLPIIRASARNPSLIYNVGYGGTGLGLGLACAGLAAAVASDAACASTGDARLLEIIGSTRVPVAGGLRMAASVVRGLLRPWGR